MVLLGCGLVTGHDSWRLEIDVGDSWRQNSPHCYPRHAGRGWFSESRKSELTAEVVKIVTTDSKQFVATEYVASSMNSSS